MALQAGRTCEEAPQHTRYPANRVQDDDGQNHTSISERCASARGTMQGVAPLNEAVEGL